MAAAVALATGSAQKFPAAQVAAGLKVYKAAGCGKCHTLKAAKSTGTVGPNLNTIKPTYSTIVGQVTNGGRFMPPFAASMGGSLSPTSVKNVAAFVYASEHK
jgi:mono/diheme cytochrome c family protein